MFMMLIAQALKIAKLNQQSAFGERETSHREWIPFGYLLGTPWVRFGYRAFTMASNNDALIHGEEARQTKIRASESLHSASRHLPSAVAPRAPSLARGRRWPQSGSAR